MASYQLTSEATQVIVTETLRDRIIGTLFGSALGDAIGLYTEFLDVERAARAYPTRSFTLYPKSLATPFRRDHHRNVNHPGDWTDDTDHAMLILLSFLHADGKDLSPKGFASRLRIWVQQGLRALDTLPIGLGHTVGAIVRTKDYLQDPEGTARAQWEKGSFNVAPNGSLMRTHPLGLMCLNKSVEETFEIAAAFSLVTHVDPRCLVSCAIGTALVRGIVLGEVRNEVHMDEMIEAGLKWYRAYRQRELEQHPSREKEPSFDLDEFKKHTEAQELADLDLDESYKIGYVYKTFGSGILLLRLAFRCLEAANNDLQTQLGIFERLTTDLTMEAGDADTNACFAGALLGALLGYKALPVHWRNGITWGDWLYGKAEGLVQTVGVTQGGYKGSEDRDTAPDGGRGLLTDAQMEERCMLSQARVAKEEREWNEREEAKKKVKSRWFGKK